MCTSGASATGKRERELHLPSNNLGFTCAGVSLSSGYKRFQARSKDQEIKRREVSWILTKKLDSFAGPDEIKRREVELDLQVSPEEIMSMEVELGCESWTSFASSCSSTEMQRTLSL